MLSKEIVFIYKVAGEVSAFEAHVLVAGHANVEVEIFNVNSHELGAGSGDYTVEEELYFEDIDSGSDTVARVVYLITTNGETHAVRTTTIWSIVDYNTAIGNIPTACGGDIGLVDEKYGVCDLDLARYSLC